MIRCSSTDCARVAHANTASIEAESIGWIALGAYLQDDNATQVLVVGVAGDAVLLVG